MVLNNQVIVLIVVAAAGAAVLCGYAITRFYTNSAPNEHLEGVGEEFSQAQYQRELRLRNTEKIAEMTGHGRHTLNEMRANAHSALS
ncbi:uncharacterized protein RCC_11259 [Ramularia collo-cygni]|uniref:Uncharacterized protein n=1 Tax=Ramularia collo-cygni TaxID=112498 RepID=A0A2D3V7Y6_9PEZI|nr:uncharacterized protein RCC_11259 [Ramularia collo-cygni]CZT25526.1 uncharacterized protein RCC_11259 [Ramularia collo-cygni]